MQLILENASLRSGAQTHLYPFDFQLRAGAITVLLGATLAGKTSLMRLMAGLDRPSSGRILVDGRDVTGLPVRDRNVAMVYQQFINYPSMSVRDNIASPLRLSGRHDVEARVLSLAQRLRIDGFLDRYPAQLSGGQQQRVALARALAKDAPLMLLDEPLVNLDYKLREELREELSALFSQGSSAVVYATTEPAEALLLGGYTAVMEAGRVLQYGPTADVFHRPDSIAVARAFSDPPMNLFEAHGDATGLRLDGGIRIDWPDGRPAVSGALTAGIRASALRTRSRPGDFAMESRVVLAEISGSDTYVHASTAAGDAVAQLTGVHRFDLGQSLPLWAHADELYLFDAQGVLLRAPRVASLFETE